MSYRALGSYDKGRINIVGRKMPRTWSLIAKKIARPVNSISLMHNPQEMVTFLTYLEKKIFFYKHLKTFYSSL